LRTVLEQAGQQPLPEVALAHADLAQIAGSRGDPRGALRESTAALDSLARVEGVYDVRLQPRVWLVHSAQLLINGEPVAAREWAAKALQASLLYDASASRAISDAKDRVRLAEAAQ
jgi:hypothetical protein